MKKSLIALVVAALTVLSGCTQGSTSSTTETNQKKNITIGVITPMSGDAAAYGQQIKRIFNYQLPLVNQKLASTGYQFSLSYEDGKCGGADAVSAFQKLTDINNVRFIIGGTCSSETLGFAPLLADKKVVAVSGWSSSPDIEGKSPYLFSLSYSDNGTAKGIATELGKYSKIALISEQNDYNETMKKNVESALKQNYPQTTIVANEKFSKGGTNFRNQLEKIKSQNPDIIFLNPNGGVTAQAMVKQLAEMNWGIKKVSTYALMADSVINASPKTVEGTIIVDAPKVMDPQFLELMKTITTTQGTLDDLGNYYTASALDALTILTQTIVDSKADPEAVKNALRTKTFTGYLGNLSFKDKTFVQGVGVARFTITNGQVQPL